MKITFEYLKNLQKLGNIMTQPSEHFFEEDGSLKDFTIVDNEGNEHYLNSRIRQLLTEYHSAKANLEKIFEK